jgi:hypothetical protein
MADYYSFIAREVSKLQGEGSRRDAYDRARDHLAAKLHQPSLRIPESEVALELRAFDATARKIEAELARGHTLDGGLPPSVPPPTSSDSSETIPTIGSEAEPEIPQTEASQIRPINDGKSTLLAGAPDAVSDLNRQMLHALGAALDLTVSPNLSTNPIGKTQTEQQPAKDNFPDPSPGTASVPPAQTNFSDLSSREGSVNTGERAFSLPQDSAALHAGLSDKSDFPTYTHSPVGVARVMSKQLINMTLTIAICCALFAVVYFSANIGKWLGF